MRRMRSTSNSNLASPPSLSNNIPSSRSSCRAFLTIGALIVGLLLTFQNLAFSVDQTNREMQNASRIQNKRMAPLVTPEMETKIGEYFKLNQCDKINSMIQRAQYPQLRPLLAAVVAYCQPVRSAAEELFGDAERQQPWSDIIFVLHARYVWKFDKAAAAPIWRKVLTLTNNQATKQMAKDYLEDTVSQSELETVSLGSIWSYIVSGQTGLSREVNPNALSISDPSANSSSSMALNTGINILIQRGFDFGSVATNYSFTSNKYFAAHTGDFTSHGLDVPVSFRVDTNADFILKPFASYLTLGNRPYQVAGGVGLVGWIYRTDYNQSITGSVFKDNYYPQELTAQEGTHFRLEYNWEFYPESWFLRFNGAFEHVSASSDIDSTVLQAITYSHNDLSLQLSAEYNLRKVIFGFSPRVIIRQDDNVSTYAPLTGNTGVPIGKRRQDFQVTLTPSLTLPITNLFQLYAWYELNRIYSNLNSNDYTDRNIVNQTLGLAIRATVSK